MKKSLIILIVLFASFLKMNAQLDVSINPIGILFNNYGITVEKGLSESFGIELTADYSAQKYKLVDESVSSNGFGVRLMGKYYLSPKNGLDRFNIAPYIKIGSNKFKDNTEEVSNFRFAGGLYIGYKIVAKSNVLFELGFGFGKAFINKYTVNGEEVVDGGDYPVFNIDATGKLAVGYRF